MGNNSEQNRHNGSSNIDERDLHEYYAEAFRRAVENAGVSSVMTSYNALNGVPMSVNKPVLEGLLRRTWGFDGFIVTDCSALYDVCFHHSWRPEGWGGRPFGEKETAALAIISGIDLNCGVILAPYAGSAVDAGLLSDNDVDKAFVRLFKARISTGEFDPGGGIYGGGLGDDLSGKTDAMINFNRMGGEDSWAQRKEASAGTIQYYVDELNKIAENFGGG